MLKCRLIFGTLDSSVLFSLRATMKEILNFLETLWKLRMSDLVSHQPLCLPLPWELGFEKTPGFSALVGRYSFRGKPSSAVVGRVRMLRPWSCSAHSSNISSLMRMKTWWWGQQQYCTVLCFLSDFDFYLLLCKICMLYTVFLFLLSQSHSNHVDSLLFLEGYLRLLPSQVENMLEVNEKIQILPIDWNTVSNYSVLSNNHSLPHPLW